MKKFGLLWGVLLSLVKSSLQASTIGSPFYVGAVVEYHAVATGKNASTIAEANAKNYRTFMKKAAEYEVDVIVFPEFGLTSLPEGKTGDNRFNATGFRAYYENTASYIPNPNESVVLCGADKKYKSYLKEISCAARDYKMYALVNLVERADCPNPNCAPGDFLLYDSNVAFDRSGKVVARYRKYNLLHDEGTNVTAHPEYSTFATDFGVTFGTFVHMDMIGEKPATFFVNNPNVTDVLLAAYSYAELPFSDGVQLCAGWAYGADVNLLVSEYSNAETGSGGSGIYGGRSGPIAVYQPRNTSNALLVAKIPKLNRQERVKSFDPSSTYVYERTEIPTLSDLSPPSQPRFYKEDLRAYTTRVFDPLERPLITTLCHEGLCCNFQLMVTFDVEAASAPNAKYYKYRLAVFNGVRDLASPITAGIEVCAVIACAGDRLDDCGLTYPSNSTVVLPTDFDALKITRHANLSERAFYMPSTLTLDEYRPIDNDDFHYEVTGPENASQLTMYLVESRTDVMTFGIVGRRYDRDGEEVSKPKSAGYHATSSIVIVAMMFMILRRFN